MVGTRFQKIPSQAENDGWFCYCERSEAGNDVLISSSRTWSEISWWNTLLKDSQSSSGTLRQALCDIQNQT